MTNEFLMAFYTQKHTHTTLIRSPKNSIPIGIPSTVSVLEPISVMRNEPVAKVAALCS